MNAVKEAVFLAGGFGTRLQSVVKDVPKPMADINGKPFLHYLILHYARQGVEHVVLSVGYLHRIISDYFSDNYLGVRISYAIEDSPLGTGGAIKQSLKLTDTNEVLVANGDTMFMVDIKEIGAFHRKNNADFTLVVREVDDVSRYGSVKMNDDGRIIGFEEKNSTKGRGYINGGVYLIDKTFFGRFGFPQKFSVEKDFFEKKYLEGNFFGKPCNHYFIDIGIPDDYLQAKNDFRVLF